MTGGAGPTGPAGGEDEDAPAKPPAWTRLIGPLRSEDAAFRTVLYAAGAALALAIVAIAVRALS